MEKEKRGGRQEQRGRERETHIRCSGSWQNSTSGSKKTVYLSPKETSIFIQNENHKNNRLNVQTREENGEIARKEKKD